MEVMRSRMWRQSERGRGAFGRLPKVDRLGDALGAEGQRDLSPQSGRRVGGAESLLHHASGFPVGDRRLLTAHAPREVPHLLGEAVVPVLLEHGIGPALGAGRLFDGVAEANL